MILCIKYSVVGRFVIVVSLFLLLPLVGEVLFALPLAFFLFLLLIFFLLLLLHLHLLLFNDGVHLLLGYLVAIVIVKYLLLFIILFLLAVLLFFLVLVLHYRASHGVLVFIFLPLVLAIALILAISNSLSLTFSLLDLLFGRGDAVSLSWVVKLVNGSLCTFVNNRANAFKKDIKRSQFEFRSALNCKTLAAGR